MAYNSFQEENFNSVGTKVWRGKNQHISVTYLEGPYMGVSLSMFHSNKWTRISQIHSDWKINPNNGR